MKCILHLRLAILEREEMKIKKFYAQYCPYGIGVSYASLNRNAYEFYAFNTREERDLWVEENEFNGRHYVASAVTRRIVEQVMGRYFKVVTNLYGDGLNVVLRKNEGEY